MLELDYEKLCERKSISYQNLDIYISLKNDFVYFMICKAASSTVTYHLRFAEYFGTALSVSGVNDVKQSPLLLPFQLKSDRFMEVINSDDFKKISFVRNPYSRILSCYLHRIIGETRMNPSKRVLFRIAKSLRGKSVSFEEFVNVICDQEASDMERHWAIQHETLLFDSINYTFIGKQENLNADLLRLEEIIYGAPRFDHEKMHSINLAPKRTNARTRLGEFYNDTLMAKVYDRYALDFSAFNYSDELPSEA